MPTQSSDVLFRSLRDFQSNLRLLDAIHAWRLVASQENVEALREQLHEEGRLRAQERDRRQQLAVRCREQMKRAVDGTQAQMLRQFNMRMLHAWQRVAHADRLQRVNNHWQREARFDQEVETFQTKRSFKMKNRTLVRHLIAVFELSDMTRCFGAWRTAFNEGRAEEEQKSLKAQVRQEVMVLHRHIGNLDSEKIDLYLRCRKERDYHLIDSCFGSWLRATQRDHVARSGEEREARLRRNFEQTKIRIEGRLRHNLSVATSHRIAQRSQLLCRRCFFAWFARRIRGEAAQCKAELAKANGIARNYTRSAVDVVAIRSNGRSDVQAAGRCFAHWHLATRREAFQKEVAAREFDEQCARDDGCATAVAAYSKRMSLLMIVLTSSKAELNRSLKRAAFQCWQLEFRSAGMQLLARKEVEHEEELVTAARLYQAERRVCMEAAQRRHLNVVQKAEAVRCLAAWSVLAHFLRHNKDNMLKGDVCRSLWGMKDNMPAGDIYGYFNFKTEMLIAHIARLFGIMANRRRIYRAFHSWKYEHVSAVASTRVECSEQGAKKKVDRTLRLRDEFVQKSSDTAERDYFHWILHCYIEAWHNSIAMGKVRKWAQDRIQALNKGMECQAKAQARDVVVQITSGGMWCSRDDIVAHILLCCCLELWVCLRVRKSRSRLKDELLDIRNGMAADNSRVTDKLTQVGTSLAAFVNSSRSRILRGRCFSCWRLALRVAKQEVSDVDRARRTGRINKLLAVLAKGELFHWHSGDDGRETLVHALLLRWQLAVMESVAPRLVEQIKAEDAAERKRLTDAAVASAKQTIESLERRLSGNKGGLLLRFIFSCWKNFLKERYLHRRHVASSDQHLQDIQAQKVSLREEFRTRGASWFSTFARQFRWQLGRCALTGWRTQVVNARLARTLDSRHFELSNLKHERRQEQEMVEEQMKRAAEGPMNDLTNLLKKQVTGLLVQLYIHAWHDISMRSRQRQRHLEKAADTHQALEAEADDLYKSIHRNKVVEDAMDRTVSSLAECCLSAYGLAGLILYWGIWKQRGFMRKERRRRERMAEDMELNYAQKVQESQKNYAEQLRRRQCKALSPVFLNDRLWFKSVFIMWHRTSTLNSAKTLITYQKSLEDEARGVHAQNIAGIRSELTQSRRAAADLRQAATSDMIARRALLLWCGLAREAKIAAAQGRVGAELELRVRREADARAAAEEEARRKGERQHSGRPQQTVSTQTGDGSGGLYGEQGKAHLLGMQPWAARVDRFVSPEGDPRAGRMLRALRFVVRRPLTGALLNMLAYDQPRRRDVTGDGGTGGSVALTGRPLSSSVGSPHNERLLSLEMSRSASPQQPRRPPQDAGADVEDMGKRALERLAQLRRSLANAEKAVADAAPTPPTRAPATRTELDPLGQIPPRARSPDSFGQTQTRARSPPPWEPPSSYSLDEKRSTLMETVGLQASLEVMNQYMQQMDARSREQSPAEDVAT